MNIPSQRIVASEAAFNNFSVTDLYKKVGEGLERTAVTGAIMGLDFNKELPALENTWRIVDPFTYREFGGDVARGIA